MMDSSPEPAPMSITAGGSPPPLCAARQTAAASPSMYAAFRSASLSMLKW